jgi:hypothetical protein
MSIVIYSIKQKCPCCNRQVIVQAVPRIELQDKLKEEKFKYLMELCYQETEFKIVKGSKLSRSVYK